MACKVFISYRRGDTDKVAKKLETYLEKSEFQDAVFLDKGDIKSGDNWPDIIKKNLAESDMMLALIGQNWTKNRHVMSGNDSVDWVELEIATALDAGKTVVPILLDGAELPVASGKEADHTFIDRLTNLQYIEISQKVTEKLVNKRLLPRVREIVDAALQKTVERILEKKYSDITLYNSGPSWNVYKATDIQLNRKVAIKVLKHPSDLKLFRDVLKHSVQLNQHVSNSVQILYVSMEQQPYYAVLNWLDGNLEKRVIDNDNRGRPIREVKMLLVKLCESLIKTHKIGFSHCNLKPSNILMYDHETPCISAFNTLHYATLKQRNAYLKEKGHWNAKKSLTEDLIYIDPETYRRSYEEVIEEERNKKTDQYLLGLIGYFALLGRHPEVIPNLKPLSELTYADFEKLERIDSYRQDCPKKLADIIQKMTQKDASERFTTIQLCLEELRSLALTPVERAKESYIRCLSNDQKDEFFSTFYSVMRQIHPEIGKKLDSVLEDKTRRKNHFSLLREGIFLLLMYAENKDKYTSEPNILSRVAESHSKPTKTAGSQKRVRHDIPPKMYEAFVKSFQLTIGGSKDMKVKGFDPACSDPEERKIILRAWQKTLEPGIKYMTKTWEKSAH